MDLWSPTGSIQYSWLIFSHLLIFITMKNPHAMKINFPRHRIANPPRIFHIIKPMELKDKLQSWFIMTRALLCWGEPAHWPEGWWEMLYSFPHRLQSDPQILARRATENWRAISPLYPYLFWYKKENFCFVVIMLLLSFHLPPHTTSFIL